MLKNLVMTKKSAKSRFWNKSAFLWAVLIFFANIFAQKTLKTENHIQSIRLSAWKKSTISADKSGAIFKPFLYALTYSNLRNLLLADQSVISYDEVIESRKLQTTRIRKISTRMVRYDRSYTLQPNTKNPDRMSGFFITKIWFA